MISVSVSGGTLSKGSREYRTPPAVAPPQVPSHYAPNYPIGHPRRSQERGPGYSTLPITQQQQPQVGLAHPITQQQQIIQPQTPPPPPPPNNQMNYNAEHHMTMPRMSYFGNSLTLSSFEWFSFSSTIAID